MFEKHSICYIHPQLNGNYRISHVGARSDTTNLKGRRHDFKLFQASGIRFHPQTVSLQDKGYQGMQRLHPNSRLPKKKPKGGQLTK